MPIAATAPAGHVRTALTGYVLLQCNETGAGQALHSVG